MEWACCRKWSSHLYISLGNLLMSYQNDEVRLVSLGDGTRTFGTCISGISSITTSFRLYI